MTKDIIYILIGQAAFILSGYIIHIYIGRSLGPEMYGIFGIITSFFFVFERLFGGAISKGLSRFVAENEKAARSIINYALKIQSFFSLIILLVFYAGAHYIAVLMGDMHLEAYMQILSLLIIIACLYIIYSAVLNGVRAFGKQAVLTMFFAFTRVLFVVLLVAAGFSLKGAVWGLILSGIACLWLSWHYCKPLTGRETFDKKALFNYSIKVLGFTFATQLIMNIDLIFVKAIMKDNLSTGLYTAAVNLARIPMLIVLPVSIVIFPSIVKTVADNDRERAAAQVNRMLRYLVLFLVPFAVMLSATSHELTSLVYGQIYSGAAAAFGILIFGLTFIAVSIIMNTVILAVCDLNKVIFFNIVLVFINIALNVLLINKFGITGAAIATTATGLIGCAFSIIYVFADFPFSVKWKSFINIILSSSVVGIITFNYSFHGVFLLLNYLLLYGIYFAVLFMLKEINSEDFNILRSVNLMRHKVHKKTV
jgi:O-antigen/teichoic acid export membrane protein